MSGKTTRGDRGKRKDFDLEGIVYYNIGLKCLVRLAVSLSSLRRVYGGNVAILSDKNCWNECKQIGQALGADIILADFSTIQGRNIHFLNKCRMDIKTPYIKTIFLDSDTIVFKDLSDVYTILDNAEFVVAQMCNWLSAERPYRNRINGWKDKIPQRLWDKAFAEPKAVNIGFYAWRRGAKIFDNWFQTALLNQDSFIPDELSCQILLPWVQHIVVGSEYNTSCKHETLDIEKCKTIHYHGRKHCRIENGQYLYHSEIWYKEFDKLRGAGFIENNIKHDKMLLHYCPDL